MLTLREFKLRFLLLAMVIGGPGCVQDGPPKRTTVGPPAVRPAEHTGESMVFIGEEPAALAHRPTRASELQLRSTYEPGPTTVRYLPGRDYLIDPLLGTLRRAPGSRIPDFRTNILFGVDDFDHSKYPGFGNGGFFAFADYTFQRDAPWPHQTTTEQQRQSLQKTFRKLASKQPLKLVAYGDSITAGGDASRPGLIFWQRWADRLREGGAAVEAINGATGGDSTVQGLQRLQAKVLDHHPDLVLIAFGMNDHNRGGVPVPQFKTNLQEIIRRIRTGSGAEVILLSAFPPNPRWHYGQGRMAEYAQATLAVAEETGVAYADVYHNWQILAARKKCEDLLANNINHPNDFGHWIYYQVLDSMFQKLREGTPDR